MEEINKTAKIYTYDELESPEAREFALAELKEIYDAIARTNPAMIASKPSDIEGYLQWNEEIFYGKKALFLDTGRYFGNRHYFSYFFSILKEVGYRKTCFFFKIRNYPATSHQYFKLTLPVIPTTPYWEIVLLDQDQENLLRFPFEVENSKHAFATLDDAIVYMNRLHNGLI